MAVKVVLSQDAIRTTVAEMSGSRVSPIGEALLLGSKSRSPKAKTRKTYADFHPSPREVRKAQNWVNRQMGNAHGA